MEKIQTKLPLGGDRDMLAWYLVSSHSEHLSCKRVNTSNIHTKLNEVTKCLFSIGQRIKGIFTDAYATYLPLLFLNKVSTVWDDCSSGAAGKPASLQEVSWSSQGRKKDAAEDEYQTEKEEEEEKAHPAKIILKNGGIENRLNQGTEPKSLLRKPLWPSLDLHAYEDHFYVL